MVVHVPRQRRGAVVGEELPQIVELLLIALFVITVDSGLGVLAHGPGHAAGHAGEARVDDHLAAHLAQGGVVGVLGAQVAVHGVEDGLAGVGVRLLGEGPHNPAGPGLDLRLVIAVGGLRRQTENDELGGVLDYELLGPGQHLIEGQHISAGIQRPHGATLAVLTVAQPEVFAVVVLAAIETVPVRLVVIVQPQIKKPIARIHLCVDVQILGFGVFIVPCIFRKASPEPCVLYPVHGRIVGARQVDLVELPLVREARQPVAAGHVVGGDDLSAAAVVVLRAVVIRAQSRLALVQEYHVPLQRGKVVRRLDALIVGRVVLREGAPVIWKRHVHLRTLGQGTTQRDELIFKQMDIAAADRCVILNHEVALNVDIAVDVDAAAVFCRGVAGDGAAVQVHSAADVDGSAILFGSVVLKRAVDEGGLLVLLDVDSAAVVRGGVAAEGAVGQRGRALDVDAAATLLGGGVVQNARAGGGERAVEVDAAAVRRGVVPDDGVAL